jgi:hypothetical protein
MEPVNRPATGPLSAAPGGHHAASQAAGHAAAHAAEAAARAAAHAAAHAAGFEPDGPAFTSGDPFDAPEDDPAGAPPTMSDPGRGTGHHTPGNRGPRGGAA